MGIIQKADPVARRIAIWMICVTTVFGFLVIIGYEYLQENLQLFFERHIDFLFENTVIVFLATLLFISPLLVTTIYFFRLGKRAVLDQRFPPHGYAVVRDTHVLEGMLGIRRGRIIQILSLFLLCCSCLTPIFMWAIFATFK